MRQRDGIVRLVQPYLRLHEFPLFGRSVLVKYNVFLHRSSLFVLLLPSKEPKVFWDDTTCLRVRSVWVLLPLAFGFTVWQTVDLMALRSTDGSQSHRIRISYVFGFELDGCIV